MNLKSLIAILGLAFIVVLIVVFVFAKSASTSGTNTSSNSTPAAPSRTLVEVNDIMGDPIVYEGFNVEIESQVSEWVTKKSFKVSTPGGPFGSGGSSLLVIGKDEFTIPEYTPSNVFGIGEKVRVHLKGRVVIVNKDQLEAYLGENFDSDEFKSLDDNHLAGWTLGPVLLLDSVGKMQ